MKVLNIGSLNLDKVYDVSHFVGAGETILSDEYSEFIGGKGLNQSIALARAGAEVCHAGAIGFDGLPLIQVLSESGVDVHLIKQIQTVSGHAVIQRAGGNNCIIVYSGANGCLTSLDIDHMLDEFEAGDILLLQNETSSVAEAILKAKSKGMKVAFNVSPITKQVEHYPLDQVDYFLVNEIEAAALAQIKQKDYVAILESLSARFPKSAIVMTVGSDGAYYRDANTLIFCEAFRTATVDTTAAGDTFAGFFLASLASGKSNEQAMHLAAAAAALAVGREGACNSIPWMADVHQFLKIHMSNGIGG